MDTIYLDNAATTRACRQAVDAMLHVLSIEYGNSSSIHSKGREANKILESSRINIAGALGADAKNIYFTSGGTEANNWALMGAAYKCRHRGKHIVSTAIEHDSVLRTLEHLKQRGFEVTLVNPEKSGSVTSDAIKEALRPDTILVSVMLVNNETGAINPIEDIAKAVKENSNALLHVDAVQGFLKIPFNAKIADMITISAHKIHGPKGIGALYIKDRKNISPILWGGSQEKGERPGTESLHNIAGFAAAAQETQMYMVEATERMTGLQTHIRNELEVSIPEAQIVPMGAPHIMSISLPGYQGETILNFLDYKNVCVSRSSACKRNARSHVLEAMGLSPKVIDGTIRVSFSRYTTQNEIEEFITLLKLAKESLLPKL